MIQDDSRSKRVNWRLIAMAVLLVVALLALTSGALAYTGRLSAWFGGGSAAGEELYQPASAPQFNSGSPLDSSSPSRGGSGCEHERMNTLPPGMD